jgi:hypothetical protein
MMIDIEEVKEKLKLFSDICRSFPGMATGIQEEIRQHEQAIMDIEHYIEFEKLSASTGYRLARQIKDIRKKRRELKDTLTVITPLISFIEKHKQVWNELDGVRGQIRKEADRVAGERKYQPRVLFELYGQQAPETNVGQALRKTGEKGGAK